MNKILERLLPNGIRLKICELGDLSVVMLFDRLFIKIKTNERKEFLNELSNLLTKYIK